MKPNPSRLDKLPVEILRHIASVGACEAVLALSRVNRSLHAACNDPLVYKAIIENRNGNGDPRWHHHLPLSIESPVSSWARYALADSKAAHVNIMSFEPASMVSWVPQLVAHNHPSLNLASPLTLTNAFELYQAWDTYHVHARSFCLALRLMSEEPAAPPGLQFMKDLIRHLPTPLYSRAGTSHATSHSPELIMHKRVQALLAVGILSVILRNAVERGGIRRMQNINGPTPAIAVPTSTTIPIHLMIDVPLPFSPGAATELATCHLAKMTNIDFLQDGEWAGFYSGSLGHRQSVHFDPPMRGIRFFATASNDTPPTPRLHGVGEDGVGTFDLDGTILPMTGQIILEKVYKGGHPVWHWDCIMTPVGIVGSWGKHSFGGWIWLWKTSWTADH